MENILQQLQDSGVLAGNLREKVGSMMKRYQQMDEKEKAEFSEEMKDLFKSSVRKFMQRSAYDIIMDFVQTYVLLFFAILFTIVVFVFFGYKLYKSLVEKERKREEKRRNKQLKKKK